MDLIGGGTDNTWVLAGPNGRVISGIECTISARRSHVFDVVRLDVGRVRARLEPLGVDVHEEVPRDVHQVEVVGVLHPRRVVAAQSELHVEPDLAGVLHLVGVEEDLGRKRD